MTYIFCTEVPSACEFFTSTWKLLELSVFLFHLQSTQCAEGSFVVVSWPLPSYLSLNPSVLSYLTWVESCHHLLGKYTFDVYSFFGHSYSRIRSFLKIVMSYDLATLHEWWRKGVIMDLLTPSSAYLVFEGILWLNLDTSCIVRQEGMALWFFLIFRQTLSHCWGYVATELFVVMFHWTFYDCVTLQLCGLGGKLLFSIFF